MFTSALKSFTSNITSHYTLSPQPSSTSGPWKIFDAKRKSTGKAASVFVFDRKSLEPSSSSSSSSGGGIGGRTSSASLKKLQEEVIERLKKEASSLARLRHPSILELHEPVEETRYGGLMFATEPVTGSLASILAEKDEQGQSNGQQKRSRFVVEESGDGGGKSSREVELDELEIQKGLLQLGKGLEFLHESAGLVHANLTPEAVLVNAKGDWKISGLAFCGPHETSTAATSLTPISLHEVLNHDSRLPRSVQLNLDYTSPDFVLDNSLTPSADIFSLGLVIISLYNSPHTSPLSTSGSLSAYKRLFTSSSTIPTQNNNFLIPTPASASLPPKLAAELLPRLITRRPAQRLTAKEFQEASYFDNILVSTIRFLDALPAKTAAEKSQFLRGLPRILPQFPKQVLEKKVLPALLEEMKDKELLAPIIKDLFEAVRIMPAAVGKKAFTEQVVPRLREVFITNNKTPAERDTAKEAALMVLLENMSTATSCCGGKEFREDVLPILLLALESPTHGLVDAAIGTLRVVLPVLDFSTIKNEVFPVVAGVFARTSSLNIKIRGLEAFYVLCGGEVEGAGTEVDEFGLEQTKKSNGTSTAAATASGSSSVILDRFTIQEKVVPLLKGIKTKEPGVMMAALKVFQQIGDVVEAEFCALEVLPVLWSFSLGPLLNLEQFGRFMELVRRLGERVEREQRRKLSELGGGAGGVGAGAGVGGAARQGSRANGVSVNGMNGEEAADFESLVSGRKSAGNGSGENNDFMNEWGVTAAATFSRPSTGAAARTQSSQNIANSSSSPAFSWQNTTSSPSKSSTPQSAMHSALRPQPPTARAITPDQPLSAYATLTPSNQSQSSRPLQPSQQASMSSIPLRPSSSSQYQPQPQQTPSQGTSIDWSAATKPTPPHTSLSTVQPQQMNGMSFGATSKQQPQSQSQGGFDSFALAPPPASPQNTGQWSSPPPLQPSQPGDSFTTTTTGARGQSGGPGASKSGLDRYESLL